MAKVDPQAIVDAIDQAVLDEASGYYKASTAGKTYEFRTFADMMDARETYAKLAAAKTSPGGIRIHKTIVGGY